jgi:exosortase/archaeosortase family protein
MLNSLQTDLTAYLVSLTLDETLTKGYEIIIDSHYSLVIEKACNGMIPYLFFLASIIAFPSSLLYKIKWGVIGYATISVINILRIWIVTQSVLLKPDNFSLTHDFIGNSMLILTALILFISFVKNKKGKK